jgi:hypothetical protein
MKKRSVNNPVPARIDCCSGRFSKPGFSRSIILSKKKTVETNNITAKATRAGERKESRRADTNPPDPDLIEIRKSKGTTNSPYNTDIISTETKLFLVLFLGRMLIYIQQN